MDIVDAQVHVGRGQIDATLECMNALGIQGLVIDEFWGALGAKEPTHILPGFGLPNGAWRTLSPTAQEAGILHPDRFSYLVRVDRNDPDLASLMQIIASEPAARAIRIQPAWTMAEVRACAEGAYDSMMELAQRHRIPVFAFIPGFVELLARYLEKFLDVSIVIDHTGMAFPGIPPDRTAADSERGASLAYFDEILKLARYPNLALKWSHAQGRFNVHDYPFEPIRALLRRAISAFGAERIMWASDHSVIPEHNWSQLLSYVRDDAGLSVTEKEWILGRTVRELLNWPIAEARSC